ncbi:MAG: GGDEF domain-containing protein, partial [Calditrichales bacterium]|nr:GGDEF domain-containing protein [Calditrichales bacterium]
TDILARFGGDEFIILLPESTNEQAKVFIDRMQILLNASMPESDLKMTFSIGLATYHTAPDSVDEIINKADMLMFSAKKDGKNMIKQKSFKA